MRAFVRFFLYLCFLLLGGYHGAVAGTHNTRVAKVHVGKPKASFGISINAHTLIKKNTPGDKKEDFIGIEDDDDELTLSRKFTLLERNIIPVPYVSLTDYPNNNFIVRLPFCRHLSYASSFKYILQRVLRL